MITRPMLAAKLESLDQLRLPALLSPKLDGIRMLTGVKGLNLNVPSVPVTRKFRPWPNHYLRAKFSDLPCLDGELVRVSPDTNKPLPFNMQQSLLDEFSEWTDAEFWVFDSFLVPGEAFEARLKRAEQSVTFLQGTGLPIKLVPHILVKGVEELATLERYFVEEQGYEGVILRDPIAPYKSGRSTIRQGWMVKVKRFEDAEAVIIGFEEEQENQNELQQDNLGYAKRSSQADGKVGKGTLGALIVKDQTTDAIFGIGSGLDQATKQLIWDARPDYVGKVIKYKFQKHGTLDAPRIPVFLGLREEADRDE